VFDGSVVPPLGKLDQPIRMTVEKGEITKVEGGREAVEFERWMNSWNHPQMRRLAHASWSFHPGALSAQSGRFFPIRTNQSTRHRIPMGFA